MIIAVAAALAVLEFNDIGDILQLQELRHQQQSSSRQPPLQPPSGTSSSTTATVAPPTPSRSVSAPLFTGSPMQLAFGSTVQCTGTVLQKCTTIVIQKKSTVATMPFQELKISLILLIYYFGNYRKCLKLKTISVKRN